MDAKQRAIKLIKEVAFVAGILVANAIIYVLTGYGIPCVFRLVTGLLCPGCGMTHAYLELCKGNLHGAMEYNLLSVTLMPVLLIYLIYKAIMFVKKGTLKTTAPEYAFYVLCFTMLFWYFVHRNFF